MHQNTLTKDFRRDFTGVRETLADDAPRRDARAKRTAASLNCILRCALRELR